MLSSVPRGFGDNLNEMNAPAFEDRSTSQSSRSGISYAFFSINILVSHYLDRSTIYLKSRWLLFFVIFGLFCLRIFKSQGFYIIAYGLGLHLLSLFLGFISPQEDPEIDGYVLPMKEDNGEYRPFIRRLPEFKFWLSSIKATSFALFLTAFSILDLPVFWPLLLFYFLLLVFLTMRQQITKMIKYKYIPISWGKESYGDITRGTNKGNKSEKNSKVGGFSNGWGIVGSTNNNSNSTISTNSTNTPQVFNNNNGISASSIDSNQNTNSSYNNTINSSFIASSNVSLHQPGNNVKMTHQTSNMYYETPLPPTVSPPPRHFPTTQVQQPQQFINTNHSPYNNNSNQFPWAQHGSNAKFSKNY